MNPSISDGIWIGRMRIAARIIIRVGSVVLFILAGEAALSWLYYAMNPGMAGFSNMSLSVHIYYASMTLLYGVPPLLFLLYEPAVLRWIVPSPDTKCPSCGYPIASESTSDMCPECGVRLRGIPNDALPLQDD